MFLWWFPPPAFYKKPPQQLEMLSKEMAMKRKSATQEIEGRIELLGKQIEEAHFEASEYSERAQNRRELAAEMTALRDEYAALLPTKAATFNTYSPAGDPKAVARAISKTLNAPYV